MNVFSFDPADYRQHYRDHGWIHVRQGMDAHFLEELRGFACRPVTEHAVTGKAIAGAKTQALYEFPSAVDFPDHLFDVVAEVGDLNRATMTLSERHIKAYDPDAAPNPTAHKDRLASQISVGLSIDVPEDSYLVLYPTDDRWPNPSNVSAELLERLPAERHPDVVLRDAQDLRINDEPGDVVMFEGSSMWHLRRNPAGTINLYLKFNDFGSDPLGEDPSTQNRRDATLATLAGNDIAPRVPALARRLDTVTHEYTRDAWRHNLLASVWNQPTLPLTRAQWELLRRVDGTSTVRELTNGGSPGNLDDVRQLAAYGVIDLL